MLVRPGVVPGAEYRGILVSCFEIAINVGLVLGYVSGLLFHNLPVHVGWRVMVGVALPPALVCLVLMFWTPESPRWLYQHGHKRQAHEVLSRCARHPPSPALLPRPGPSQNHAREDPPQTERCELVSCR